MRMHVRWVKTATDGKKQSLSKAVPNIDRKHRMDHRDLYSIIFPIAILLFRKFIFKEWYFIYFIQIQAHFLLQFNIRQYNK